LRRHAFVKRRDHRDPQGSYDFVGSFLHGRVPLFQ
jgi:hypothetical protein